METRLQQHIDEMWATHDALHRAGRSPDAWALRASGAALTELTLAALDVDDWQTAMRLLAEFRSLLVVAGAG